MHVVRAFLFSFFVAVSISFGLTFLPLHTLRLGMAIPGYSQSASQSILERSFRELSDIRIHGRIEQIERRGDGIYVQVSSDQKRLDVDNLLDAYSIIFRLISRANVPTVQVDFENLQTTSKLGTVTAKSGNLTNPLPKSEEIVYYVKHHFDVQYNE